MSEAREFETQAPHRTRWLRLATFIILLAGLGIAVDALFVEPYAIEVTHSEIHGRVAAPLKIAHLTDLHTHGVGRRERRMFAVLEAEKPDLIVITGDTLAGWGGNYRMCRDVLQRLHAPLGVWTVRGNWENWKPLRHEASFYQAAGVHLLVNAGALVRPDVWLAGLDDPYSGTARLDAALAGAPPDAFTIALFHSPAFFDHTEGRAQLSLAGHTHGGQVHIPLIPTFWLPRGSGDFLAGWYEGGDSKMYVSRGLGTSILPVRFLCRPELAFITVEP